MRKLSKVGERGNYTLVNRFNARKMGGWRRGCPPAFPVTITRATIREYEVAIGAPASSLAIALSSHAELPREASRFSPETRESFERRNIRQTGDWYLYSHDVLFLGDQSNCRTINRDFIVVYLARLIIKLNLPRAERQDTIYSRRKPIKFCSGRFKFVTRTVP